MKNTLRHLRNDQRGFWATSVGLGFMAFFAATMLAVDVGMFMTARTQAQNAADAGALAGATGLVFNSFTDHSASGPAAKGALSTSKTNLVIAKEPSVEPGDVTFPPDPDTGEFDRVQVSVYRTEERGNPIATMIGQFFGISTANVKATATAAAVPANSARCVLPFTIPDKWKEMNSCASSPCTWTTSDTFTMFDKFGNPLPKPDIYVSPGHSNATGYSPVTDKGLQLVLKNNNGTKVSPSLYNPWDLPGSVGGADYRANIGGCNPHLVENGQYMTPENGNMTGPTQQGIADLIALDPGAYWDTGCKCVKGSAYRTSPRIRIAPLYDPQIYAEGQQSGKSGPQLEVVNYLGFFVESVTGGGDVTGRIMPVLANYSKGSGSAIGSFARALMLVK